MTQTFKSNAVELRSVSKSYGSKLAVDDLSLNVPSGSIYGFIGPNGSGKTTTIRMILHIIESDRGSIEVLGEQTVRSANDRIGYMPEERGLYKKMKAIRVLEYYGMLKGMKRSEARKEGSRLLSEMGLGDCENKKIESLSKGMAQKVQFIATIIAKPDLLILDEPFSGLDPVNLEVIRQKILELRDQGTTVIFSTHDMSVAEKMCDFVFMIYKGKKVLDGSLNDIQDNYGEDTIRLRTEKGNGTLEGIPGIERVINMGKYQEVQISCDENEFLTAVMQRSRIQLFERARPSLHDIFIRIANPTEEDSNNE